LWKAADRLSLRCSDGARPTPQRILQPLGQSHEALTTEHDMGVLPAREGQAEVIEAGDSSGTPAMLMA